MRACVCSMRVGDTSVCACVHRRVVYLLVSLVTHGYVCVCIHICGIYVGVSRDSQLCVCVHEYMYACMGV